MAAHLQAEWGSLHQNELDDAAKLREGLSPPWGQPDNRRLFTDAMLRQLIIPPRLQPAARQQRQQGGAAADGQHDYAEEAEEDEYILDATSTPADVIIAAGV